VRLFTQAQALKRAPLFEALSRKELVLLARVTEDVSRFRPARCSAERVRPLRTPS
jgi:hypothetical protein